ncbi:acyl carrier protein [Actinophytocola sp.]|uniref:acyl carrier protein n=1 Tax=Actinophytocola sp. TaxID=1872138 RepID=UPI0025C36C6C|nr:acyl carrier protein [Actinophytocola sp.]
MSGVVSDAGLAFITDFVRGKCPDVEAVGIDDDLVDSGILHSLHFVDLLYLIEEELGREVSMDEVTADDFRTIARIRERFFGDERTNAETEAKGAGQWWSSGCVR